MLIERYAPQFFAQDKMNVSNIYFINGRAGGAYMANYNIGVDYHKKFTYMVVKDQKGKVLKNGQVLNTKNHVETFLKPFSKDSEAVLESCRNWCVMHDWLEDIVDRVTLANPRKVKAIAEAKIKTDKIDASVLADLLRADMVPSCYIAPREVRDKRNLLRERIFFVRMRTMAKNRITTIFDRYPEEVRQFKAQTDLFGKKGREQLESIDIRQEDRSIINRELKYIDSLNGFIKEVEVELEKSLNDNKNVQILRSIPGIGKFFSHLIEAEIGEIGRFKDERKLACYVGLVPSTYSSGGKTTHGQIIKQGNKYLRWAFVEAVIPAVRSDERLKFEYELLRQRMNWNKAKVAMARKVLTIAFHCLKKQQKYKKLNQIELEYYKLRRSA